MTRSKTHSNESSEDEMNENEENTRKRQRHFNRPGRIDGSLRNYSKPFKKKHVPMIQTLPITKETTLLSLMMKRVMKGVINVVMIQQ